MMTPVFDKVYLTAKIDEAIRYAYFRLCAGVRRGFGA
jgi:hypothetical protein